MWAQCCLQHQHCKLWKYVPKFLNEGCACTSTHRTSFQSFPLKLPPNLTMNKGEKHRSMAHKLLMETNIGKWWWWRDYSRAFSWLNYPESLWTFLYTVIRLRLNWAKLKLLHQIPALRPPWRRDLSAALQVAASGPRGNFNLCSTTKFAADYVWDGFFFLSEGRQQAENMYI